MNNEQGSEYDKEQAKRITRSFRYALAASILVLGTGMVFYHAVEKLNWIDAAYFCVITLTTIGYGDIVPTTDAGKIFTIFYVLVGVGIIAVLVNLLIKRAVVVRHDRHDRKNKP